MNRPVIAIVEDLFFASKIRGTAEQHGVNVKLARKAAAFLELAKSDPPSLFIIDLNAENFDPLALAAQLKADETLRNVPIVGFLSHVQVDLQRAAEEIGVDSVFPRSAFTKLLPDILQRAR